jgi:large subunit ribosomal protein L24
MKIRLNDTVIIRTGKDRGKTGTVAKVLAKDNKIVVRGINKCVKHVKGKEGNVGERVEFDGPIHVSNVSVLDPKSGKATRIGYSSDGNVKTRIAKKSGETLPVQKGKKKIETSQKSNT